MKLENKILIGALVLGTLGIAYGYSRTTDYEDRLEKENLEVVTPEEQVEEPLIPQEEIDEAEAEIEQEEKYGPDLEEKI